MVDMARERRRARLEPRPTVSDLEASQRLEGIAIGALLAVFAALALVLAVMRSANAF